MITIASDARGAPREVMGSQGIRDSASIRNTQCGRQNSGNFVNPLVLPGLEACVHLITDAASQYFGQGKLRLGSFGVWLRCRHNLLLGEVAHSTSAAPAAVLQRAPFHGAESGLVAPPAASQKAWAMRGRQWEPRQAARAYRAGAGRDGRERRLPSHLASHSAPLQALPLTSPSAPSRQP